MSKQFAASIKGQSTGTIGFSQEHKVLRFSRGHKVNGMVLTETSASANFPTMMEIYTSTQKMRGMPEDQAVSYFLSMMAENEDLAIRMVLYLRDIREGAGERSFPRLCLTLLSDHPNISNIIDKIPMLGRFDDLLLDWRSANAMELAVSRYVAGFSNDNEKGLAAKWAPRKGLWAYRLRKALGLNPSDYRKMIVRLSSTVEQRMCRNDWDRINYSVLPSQAHANYRKAFLRHTPDRYARYVEELKKPDAATRGVKINAGAIEPHELAAKVSNFYGSDYTASLDAQFAAIPYDFQGLRVFPIVDVSPSMNDRYAIGQLTCKQVAMSLGSYIAMNQTGDMNGLLMTFSEHPKMVNYAGQGFSRIITDLNHQDWGMYTDLTASMKLLFSNARANGVTEEELPDVMIVFSDMQFSGSGMANYRGNKYQQSEVEHVARKNGYAKIPLIIFWNLQLQPRGQTPKVADTDMPNVIMVSGFSTKILKGIGKIVQRETVVSTDTVMLETLLSERYDYQ